MTLKKIKKLNNKIISDNQFEMLEESEYVEWMECVGFSSSNIGCLWWDVKLVDGTSIDVFCK